MNKQFHHVKISVFLKEGEDSAFLDKILPLPKPIFLEKGVKKRLKDKNQDAYLLKKEQAEFREQRAKGFEETIIIESFMFAKNNHVMSVFKKIVDNVPEDQLVDVKTNILKHVDDEGKLFLRLDKAALQKEEFRLTQRGDCVHLAFAIAAYPRNIKTIHEKAKGLL